MPASKPSAQPERAYGDLIELALARRSRSGRHVIFYRLGPDEVIVQRILHERMDPSITAGLNLEPCFTLVKSPESNGIAEAFVKTFKRD